MKDGSSSREKPDHQVVDKGPVALARGEAGFTPGPWENRHGELFGAYGKRVVVGRAAFSIRLAQPSNEEVANGQLMEAAAGLYEALQGIIDWADFALNNRQEFDSHGVRNLDGPAFDIAREALSKARGEG